MKHRKDKIDDLKKERNTFSVALKASKKEKLKAIKDFEKDKKRLEEKINKLNEFRNMKLAEERESKNF